MSPSCDAPIDNILILMNMMNTTSERLKAMQVLNFQCFYLMNSFMFILVEHAKRFITSRPITCLFLIQVVLFLCPSHDNGRGIKCYPCPSARPSVRLYVRTYVHTYVRTYVRTSVQRRPLFKSNTFDHNFIKLGHIVKYHDVFKFDNGPYRIWLSVVMALCL